MENNSQLKAHPFQREDQAAQPGLRLRARPRQPFPGSRPGAVRVSGLRMVLTCKAKGLSQT